MASAVLNFNEYYIKDDGFSRRFTWIVLAFVFRIFLIIRSLNIVRIFLGWDGLGVISFILVIYYSNESSLGAGIITALTNRVGDIFILLRVALLASCGRWDFMLIKSFPAEISLLVVIAAITKRAQIPFSAWLPAAIAAPTPVRALVHSSTLVTAGVYLLIRFNFNLAEDLPWFIYIGAFTACMARCRACFEMDLKKIVALSTLSQLGVIMVRVSVGACEIALLHLIRHAFFKALLFVCRGILIHRSAGRQDMRAIGGWSFSLPFVFSCILLSRIALCGLFFLAGFYSKDLLVEKYLRSGSSFFTLVLVRVIVGISSAYSLRVIARGVGVSCNLLRGSSCVQEGKAELIRLTKLALLAIIGGAILVWSFFTPTEVFVLKGLKYLALLVTFTGILLGVYLNSISIKASRALVSRVGRIRGLPYISPLLGVTFGNWWGKNRVLRDLSWGERFGGGGVFSAVRKGLQTRTLSSFLTRYGWQRAIGRRIIISLL